jgi:hypothetical protein
MHKYQIFISDENTHGERGQWAVAVAPRGEDEGWDIAPDAVYNTIPQFLKAVVKAIKSGELMWIDLAIDDEFKHVADWGAIIRQMRKYIKVTLN